MEKRVKFAKFWVLIVFWLVCINTQAYAAELNAKQRTGTITIDGSLSEADWSTASSVNFMISGNSGDGTTQAYTAKALWDSTYLYIGAILTDGQIETSLTSATSDAFTCSINNGTLCINTIRVDGAGDGAASKAINLSGTLNSAGDTDTQYSVEMRIPWTDIGTVPSGGQSVPADFVGIDHDNSPGAAWDIGTKTFRYLKMLGVDRATGNGYSLYEFAMSGVTATSATASSVQGNDLANRPDLAFDGNTSTTKWSSNWTDNEWIYVDLKNAQTFNKVILEWEAAYGKSYKIQVSNDASSWTDVFTTTSGDGGTDTIVFSSQTARYVRMLGTERGTAWGYSLYEFEIYNGSAQITTTATAASSVQGNDILIKSDLASDGDMLTRWGSDWNDNEWIYVDCKTTQTFNTTTLTWEAAYATAYKLQISDDASTWTDIYSTTSGDGGTDTIGVTKYSKKSWDGDGDSATTGNYIHLDIPPTISSATVASTTTITVTFSEVMDAATFNTGDFLVKLDGVAQTISSVTPTTGTSSTCTLTLANPIGRDTAPTVEFVGTGSGELKDDDGTAMVDTTAVTATARQSTYTVKGTAKDSKSNKLLSDITVELYEYSPDETLKETVTTNQDGEYFFFTTLSTASGTTYKVKFPEGDLYKEKYSDSFVAPSDGSYEMDENQSGAGLIDPFGVVYDSVTMQVIGSATVTCYNSDGTIFTKGIPSSGVDITEGDGKYNFFVLPGVYYLTARYPNYSNYTSPLITVTDKIVEWNIPLTPLTLKTQTNLAINKIANRNTVSIGDMLSYTVSVSNINATTDATNLQVVDTLPHGFYYIDGTSTKDGVIISNPSGTNVLTWSLGSLASSKSATITYRVRVGVDVKVGKNTNFASAAADMVVSGTNTSVSSGTSSAIVTVNEGVFSSKGLVIGKVFEDKNGNGVQEEDEYGIPYSTIITEQGYVVTTDEYGKFSIVGLDNGEHILRLTSKASNMGVEGVMDYSMAQDSETLGQGTVPEISKFVRVPNGGIAKVNFPVPSAELSKEGAEPVKSLSSDTATDFIFVGLVDGEVGKLKASGATDFFEQGKSDGFENGTYSDGKTVFYLKGKIKGKYLLTASFDSEKDYQDKLHEYIDPERYYPLYGDTSAQTNETGSQGKLYVKLNVDKSFFMYGNFATKEFTKRELTSYNREFSGVNLHIESPDKDGSFRSLTLFGAYSKQEQKQDRIAANGISGPYYLGNTPMLEYTERVRLEIRDKAKPEVVIREITKVRGIDYDIEYDIGKLTFRQPVASWDEESNPVYIVVDYEYLPTASNANYIYGLRGELGFLKDALKIGMMHVTDESNSAYHLTGVDTEISLGKNTKMLSELAYSDGSGMNDYALSLKGETHLTEKLGLRGYYKDVQPNFSNPVNLTEQGVKRWGAGTIYDITDNASFVVDHYNDKLLSAHNNTDSTSFELIGGQEKKEDSILRTDIENKFTKNAFKRIKDDFFYNLKYEHREFEESDNLVPDYRSNIVSGKLGRELVKNKLIVSIEREHALTKERGVEQLKRSRSDVTSLNVDHLIDEKNILYVSHKIIDSKGRLDEDTNRTILGIQTQLDENTQKYMEYDTSLGRQSTGYNTKMELSDDLTSSVSFERSITTGATDTDSLATSASFDWNPDNGITAGTKHEVRDEGNVRMVNHEAFLKSDLNEEIALLTKYGISTNHDESKAAMTRVDRDGTIALSYRPIYYDRLNLIAKYEFEVYRDIASAPLTIDQKSQICSLEGIFDVTSKLQLSTKYAVKQTVEKMPPLKSSLTTDMISSGLMYNFTDKLDITTEYRIIRQDSLNEIKSGCRLELGYKFIGSLRMGFGYNFLDYENERATSNDYSAKGPYLKVSGKFEEPMKAKKQSLKSDKIVNSEVKTEKIIESGIVKPNDSKPHIRAKALYRKKRYEAKKQKALVNALTKAQEIATEEAFFKEPEKKTKEILVTPERAGAESYYVPGEGYKLTKSLGVGVKMEVFEDPRSAEDCISWVVGERPWEFTNAELREKLTPPFTRVYGIETIFKYEDHPRLKYVYEYKDEPKEDYPSQTDTHEFNILQTFFLFGRDDFLTLNPIYRKSYFKSANPWWGPEERNDYLLNYNIKLNDSLDLFGQIDSQRAKKSNTPGLDQLQERYYRIELRKNFPDSRFRVTPGFKYSIVDERPSSKNTVRYETYLDAGKDFTDRWSGSTRLEYILSDKSEESSEDPRVFNINNKLSYNMYKDFHVSGYLNYSKDLSDIDSYDVINFIGEVEYYKWGFLRWNLGYRRTEYVNLDVDFDTIYFKIYFFI